MSTGNCRVAEAAPGNVAALADCLEAALLVTDRGGVIQMRNHCATHWLSGGDTLPAALARGRFWEPFHRWTDVVTSIFGGATLIQFEGMLPLSEQADPEPVIVRCTPFRDGHTAPVSGCVLLVLRGSVREDFKERLEVSSRLASLGKRAARVAHELNNPLDGILRYVNLALRVADEAPEPRLKDYLSQSRSGLLRMVQIIGDLLEYTRGSRVLPETTGLNEVVRGSVREAESAAADKAISISLAIHAPDVPLTAAGRIHQICANLLRNAVDATPRGGRITVTTDAEEGNLVIRVADTGCGLPDPPEKVFEPFFTTKSPGQGTGLGLAICRDFVEDMGGRITADRGEDGGAVFTIVFPKPASCRTVKSDGATHVASATD